MKICNCTLPSIHGQKVCDKCVNNNDNRQDEYMMDMIDINKYIKIAEDCGLEIISTKLEPKEKCGYCEVDKLNLLIESDKIWNMIYFFAGKDKQPQMDDIDTVDNSVVLEVRNGQGYLRLGDRGEMQCIDHSEILKINYCPMCGRKL